MAMTAMATATATTVGKLVSEHPADFVKETDMESQSRKEWAREFLPIRNSKLQVHTQLTQDELSTIASFDDAFLPELDDDTLRFQQAAYPPNKRPYRLFSEEDGITWFHSEISNIVLPAFTRYPCLTQVAHDPPKSSTLPALERVDVAYMAEHQNRRTHVVIGEFKRGILRAGQWQHQSLDSQQQNFSRELRGYAYKYGCPQIFCFDHATFLMLQFRVGKPADIKTDCDVDCWVFPRDNIGGTPIRYALYRLLVQGYRRFQGMWRFDTALNNIRADRCNFFSGKPAWKTTDGSHTSTPFGYTRKADPVSGGLYWVDKNGDEVLDQDNCRVWDTPSFWEV